MIELVLLIVVVAVLAAVWFVPTNRGSAMYISDAAHALALLWWVALAVAGIVVLIMELT